MDKKLEKLTHAQIGIYNADTYYKGTSLNNITGVIYFNEYVKPDNIFEAFNMVLLKNEVLRTRITLKGGEAYQYTEDFKKEPVTVWDFSRLTDTEINNILDDENRKSFDILDNKLYMFSAIRWNDGRTGFYVRMHHIISDSFSMTIFGSKMAEYCNKIKNGVTITKELDLPYGKYIERERNYKISDRYKKDRQYWEGKFSEPVQITQIKDYDKKRTPNTATRKLYKLSKGATNKVNEYCSQNNTSPYILFNTALVSYLARTLQKEDIIIGTPLLNRNGIKERNTIGCFTQILPLCVKLDMSGSFTENLNVVSREIKALMAHQYYPYDLIQEDYKRKHNENPNLFDIVFSYQNAKFDKRGGIDFESKWLFAGSESDSFMVHIADRENEGRLEIAIDYFTHLFEEWEIDSIYSNIKHLLLDGMINPNKKLKDLRLLSKRETRELTLVVNDTEAEYNKGLSVKDIFSIAASSYPDKVALVFESKKMTYKELDDASNSLARYIRSKGVKKGSFVGICLENSFEMIIGILAVVKAGATYVPILTNYPEERRKYIIENSNIKVMLTKKKYLGGINDVKTKICIDLAADNKVYKESTEALKVRVLQSDNLYVLYTSGSTGMPKGVVINHKNIVRLLFNSRMPFDFSEDDIWLMFHSFTFDISAWEMYGALLYGGKLILVREDDRIDSKKMFDLIIKKRVSVLNQTPSAFYNLTNQDIKRAENCSLKYVTLAGEEFKIASLAPWKEVNKNIKFINMYGSTETTVHTTYKDMKEEDIKIGSKSVGFPMPTQTIYILDEYMNLLPKNVYGEICIGGDGVGVKYLNNPELTSKKFVPNPFGEGMLYRTGDIGRRDESGEVLYLGRRDNQVKIRGFRIETLDIENQANKIDEVSEARVVVEKAGDGHRLILYFTASSENYEDDVRKELGMLLPEYMMPSKIIQVPFMPVNVNGKLDRAKLAEYGEKSARVVIKPRTDDEICLAEIVGDVLEVKRVNITDNFFEIGGDSLNVMRFSLLAKREGYDISIEDIYEGHTIENILKILKGKAERTDEKDKPLDIKVPDKILIKNKHVKRVFLTGVTGYLGMHILKELLKYDVKEVYCLIRNKNGISINERFSTLINYYCNKEEIEKINKVVKLFEGDIEKENMGLGPSDISEITRDDISLIHAAANVKHYGEYKDFKRSNVDGAINVAEFCIKHNIPMHHISTTSVSGSGVVDIDSSSSVFTETDLYIGQRYNDNVYVKSKYEAEKKLLEMPDDALTLKIYRVGNLMWRRCDGRFQRMQDENMFIKKVKELKELGLLTNEILNKKIELTPVDKCAEAIVKLVMSSSNQKIYHIFNDDYITIGDVFKVLGYNGELETAGSFARKLKTDPKRTSSKFIVIDLKDGNFDAGRQFEISNDLTKEYLKKVGFKWNSTNSNYVKHLKKLV